MSRYAARPAEVMLGASGTPVAVVVGGSQFAVLAVADHWREWYDVLDGQPERDVWLLETEKGICEIHGLRNMTTSGTMASEKMASADGVDCQGEAVCQDFACDQWLLCRWED